jgi:hypothetical protein
MIFHNPDYIVNKTDKTPNIACNSIKKRIHKQNK